MKVTKVDADSIEFDDGSKITYFHEQDCCEHVYADFEQLKDTSIFSRIFVDIDIEGVENSGFKVNGYFVPCYNSQNGYYSSDLTLVIERPNKKKEEIDISQFVEDTT